jgi:hypothetical protein
MDQCEVPKLLASGVPASSNNWLETYAYRVLVGWLMFVILVVVILLMAALTTVPAST